MKIQYTPQQAEHDVQLSAVGEKLSVTVDGENDVFDFSKLPDGQSDEIESDLTDNPVVSAWKANGELTVEVINWYRQEDEGSEGHEYTVTL